MIRLAVAVALCLLAACSITWHLSAPQADDYSPPPCPAPPSSTRGFEMHLHTYPTFALAAIIDPPGFKPGLYWYVLYLPENRKVSRYCRRSSTAAYKLGLYAAKWAEGERNWPEVGRVAELRDSRYVIPSRLERHLTTVKAWWGRVPAMRPVYDPLVRLP